MLNPLNPENTKEEKIARSIHFLELYKQGNSYQKIGDMYGLSRERVRQILNRHPSFRKYQQEQKEAKAYSKAKKERIKAEQEKENLYSRSLAVLYPDRVAELWDYEKNGELKPDHIFANATTKFIWLKCPIDGHSWKKKPNDITTSWSRSGTTGCPLCAGKRKKAKKQPTLIEVYPKLISQYWNYEFNLSLMGLNIDDYIQESARTLKLDGQLWIYEIDSHIKNLHKFTNDLELAGFKIIELNFPYTNVLKKRESLVS